MQKGVLARRWGPRSLPRERRPGAARRTPLPTEGDIGELPQGEPSRADPAYAVDGLLAGDDPQGPADGSVARLAQHEPPLPGLPPDGLHGEGLGAAALAAHLLSTPRARGPWWPSGQIGRA